jgi:hypothetical protein
MAVLDDDAAVQLSLAEFREGVEELLVLRQHWVGRVRAVSTSSSGCIAPRLDLESELDRRQCARLPDPCWRTSPPSRMRPGCRRPSP